jgi:hypothetical protein
LFTSLSLVIQAQEKGDTKKQDKSEMTVSISVNDLSSLKQEVQEYKKLQQEYTQLSQQDSANICELKKISSEYDSLKRNYDSIVKSQELANKKLVNIASNFLYIPYEAYSIQEIAIPAFNAVTDEQLRNKHQVKLDLLENYQQDIRNLLAFISDIEKELSIPFTKDLESLNQRYLNMDFYQRYRKYDNWKNTYLGKKINDIDVKMKSYNGRNKPDFTSIKEDLNQCLETAKNL